MPEIDGTIAEASRTSAYTRREFLKAVAGGAAAVGTGAVLAACSSTSATPTTTKAGATAKRGGTLRLGMTGGSSADTLNPLHINTNLDICRQMQLYDSLAYLDDNAQTQLMLAEEMTPNSDASEWTIRLRSGVTWHNGKDLTADDVIYSIQQMADPKNAASAGPVFTVVDVGGMKQIDKLTCRVPMLTPYATFMDTWATRNFVGLFPRGFDPRHPIGTGPFKYESFTPGDESVFSRNDNYWMTGLPYADSVVVTDFQNETSQVNALASGQVNAINNLSAASIAAVTSDGDKVVIEAGGVWTPFFVRVDLPPFTDIRVRTAMKLLIDRKQMLDLVFDGHGIIGNDMFGIFDGAYDHALPQREQDLDQARFLLKKAGQENLNVRLVVADLAQGLTLAAQVFKQQAAGAGVTINLDQTTDDGLFANYLKWPFSVDFWLYNPYFLQAGVSCLPTSDFNETHFGNTQYTALYKQAQSTVDKAQRDQLGQEMDKIFYDQSGYIIPYFAPTIDGYSSTVRGVGTSKVGGSFNNFDLATLWMA